MRLTGRQLQNMRELRDLLRVNTEGDAVRYLISRGMEASAVQLATMRTLNRLEKEYAPQELLPFLHGGKQS